MDIERMSGGNSLIDVLDRVLDKGIVIDASARVFVMGIDLITVEARIVVASIATYQQFTEAVAEDSPAPPPAAEKATPSTLRRAWGSHLVLLRRPAITNGSKA